MNIKGHPHDSIDPVLNAQLEDSSKRLRRGVARAIPGRRGQPGDKSGEEGLVIIQVCRLFTYDCRWQLLVVTNQHKLVELQLEGDKSLRLDTLAGLIKDANGHISHLPCISRLGQCPVKVGQGQVKVA